MIEIGSAPGAYGAFLVHSTDSGKFMPCGRDELAELVDALSTPQGIAGIRAFLAAPEDHPVSSWYPGDDRWGETS